MAFNKRKKEEDSMLQLAVFVEGVGSLESDESVRKASREHGEEGDKV